MTTLNQTVLVNYIKQKFYPRDPFVLNDIVQHNTGWENDVYSISITADAAGFREYILRIYQGTDAATKAMRESVGIERLRSVGYPVPIIYAVEQDPSYFGKSFVLMEKIQGSMLSAVMRTAGAPEARKHWFTGFIRLLADLHQLNAETFTGGTSDLHANSYAGVDPFLALLTDAVHRFDVSEVEPYIEWLKRNRDEVPSQRLSVVHWDYHPENVIVRDDGTMVVIDWTQIEVLDARFDVAWTALLTTTQEPELYPLILKEYERLVGQPLEQLWYFEAAVLVKRLVTMLISIRHGGESLGMRPDVGQRIAENQGYIDLIANRLSSVTGIRAPSFGGYLL